jgi:hypothetical protein
MSRKEEGMIDPTERTLTDEDLETVAVGTGPSAETDPDTMDADDVDDTDADDADESDADDDATDEGGDTDTTDTA